MYVLKKGEEDTSISTSGLHMPEPVQEVSALKHTYVYLLTHIHTNKPARLGM